MTLDEAKKRYRDKEAEYKELASMYKEYEEFEMLREDNCQLAEWLTELKEARKLLTSTKYKTKHEEWDLHGEHYRGDYALCPNCDKVFTNIHDGKVVPVVMFCPDCGQKIDWSMGGSENG